MSRFKELGTNMVDDIVSGASGPLGSLFGDKHSSTSLSFPSDVEGIGQRHFIRFNVVNIDGSTFGGVGGKSSTSADTSVAGELIGGAVGAAVGGGIGGGILASIAGNAADSLGVSTAVQNIADAGLNVADTVVGQAAGIADDLAAGVEGAAQEVVGGAVGAVGDLAGGVAGMAGDLAGDAVGAVGDLLSGNLPDLPSLDDLKVPSLEDLKVPLPNPADILNLDNAWTKIEAAATKTWGNLSTAAGSIQEAIGNAAQIAEDSLKGMGEDFTQGSPGTSGTRVQSVADIILYIPQNITENYQSQWAGGERGMADNLTVSGVSKVAQDALKSMVGGGATTTALEDAMNSLGISSAGAKAELIGKIKSSIFNNPDLVKSELKRSGIGVDPHFDLLFTGVQARQFTFEFKMAPRNPTEAQMVANIIRVFKMYSAPVLEEGSAKARYWQLPCYFNIEYWNADKTHKIKPCALTNIGINYTGSGDNHTFYDGYPIQTDLTLTFVESSLLTRSDFESGDNGGY